MAREIVKIMEPTEVHHGCCEGADQQIGVIARDMRIRVIAHPPLDESKMAFCPSDEQRPPKAYMARNQDIVDECDVLMAAPKGMKEELRSGTWATVRRARKSERRIVIVWPDGTWKSEGRW